MKKESFFSVLGTKCSLAFLGLIISLVGMFYSFSGEGFTKYIVLFIAQTFILCLYVFIDVAYSNFRVIK